MPNLTVLATAESDERLRELIERLKENPGYGPGREVREDKGVPGKYILTIHNGEQDLDSQSVRVVSGMIIAGKAKSTIENILREAGVGFKEYSNVEIPNPNATPLRLQLPEKPQLVYSP